MYLDILSEYYRVNNAHSYTSINNIDVSLRIFADIRLAPSAIICLHFEFTSNLQLSHFSAAIKE